MVKKLCLFISILFLFISLSFAEDYVYIHREYTHVIDTELEDAMENGSPEELYQVIVEFDKLIDTQWMYSIVKRMNKQERREYTITTLQEFTAVYQEEVYSYLESMQNAGDVERLSQLWLTNSIGMKATREVIEEVAKHPKVALIWHDKHHLKPHVIKAEEDVDNTPDSRAVVWNVTMVNADDVWSLGYTGAGIIVGHIDTGVNYNHVDLADHLWDGGSSYPNHGWDFENNDNDPMDDNGHGTHTAGTCAGDGTAGTQTGVAPDAQIMCLKAIGGLTVLQNSVNFGLTNGASVFSMSAGWDSSNAGGSWTYISTQCRYIFDNCLNATVTFSTSAGNGNPYGGHFAIPYDISIPANVPAAWYGSAGHSSCIAVGSVNSNQILSSFSSRGATQWMFSPWYEYQYPPGLIKPDMMAGGGSPGVTSLSYSNNTGYVGGYFWQGTSMSCPAVTGAVTLLLEKDPNLTPEDIDSILETTATDLGSTGKDNYYGAGLLNCLAAIYAVGVEEESHGVNIPEFKVTCFPNPTAHSSTIHFSIPHTSDISLDIIDVSGRKVAHLASGEFEKGNHQVTWNGQNVPKGVYFIRLKAEGKEYQGKLILIQ
jgi:subtilisin family serine protease